MISIILYLFSSDFKGIRRAYLMNGARISLFMAIEGAGVLKKEEKEKIRWMISESPEVRALIMEHRLSAMFVRVFGLWNGLRLYRKLALIKGKIKEVITK